MTLLDTRRLSIAYEDRGAPDLPAVLLIHGWPDDASTWEAIVPRLVDAGLRVVVPTLRGFGDTRFHDPATLRTGNSGILAMDAIDLMDGLGIEHFAVVGHDWGSNIAEALAVGWPDRIQRIAMLSTPPRLGGMPTPPFRQAQRQWYHWFMATERGADAVRNDRRGFARVHWENWSPSGWFDEATFERVADAWDNPDWVDVTIHSYRARWDEAEPDPDSKWLEDKIKSSKTLSLPALYVHGEEDGVNPPSTAETIADKFTGVFEREAISGVGHFPQREAPDQLAAKLVAFLHSRTT